MRECLEELPSCLLTASSGGVLLLTFIWNNIILILSYIIVILSLSLALYFSRGPTMKFSIILLSVIFILFSINGSLNMAIIILYILIIIVTYRMGDLRPGLSLLPMGELAFYLHGGSGWARVYSGAVILLASLLAYLESGRGHSLMLSAAAPLVLFFPPVVDTAAAVSSLGLALVLSGIVGKSACPFTIDSGMVFAGVVLSIVGVLLGIMDVALWFPIWVTGFLYLEAGILVPLRAPGTASS